MSFPADQRAIFIQNEMEERSFREISEETGISINTLLSRKRYAIMSLRKRLQRFYDDVIGKEKKIIELRNQNEYVHKTWLVGLKICSLRITYGCAVGIVDPISLELHYARHLWFPVINFWQGLAMFAGKTDLRFRRRRRSPQVGRLSHTSMEARVGREVFKNFLRKERDRLKQKFKDKWCSWEENSSKADRGTRKFL